MEEPSITASNAIEGVTVDADRALKIAEGAPRLRNRNEKEFAGYRDAIDGLMRMEAFEPLSLPLILHLDRQLFEHAGGRGGHLKDGRELHRFLRERSSRGRVHAPRPQETGFLLRETVDRYNQASRSDWATHSSSSAP